MQGASVSVKSRTPLKSCNNEPSESNEASAKRLFEKRIYAKISLQSRGEKGYPENVLMLQLCERMSLQSTEKKRLSRKRDYETCKWKNESAKQKEKRLTKKRDYETCKRRNESADQNENRLSKTLRLFMLSASNKS